MHDKPLKTRQLAEMLGVSCSTIKRWADRGELPVMRTLGRHRLIPPAEAIRFARERGLPTDSLLRAAGELGEPEAAAPGGEVTRDDLITALKRGRAATARELIHRAYDAKIGAHELADGLIRPAMAAIGHAWERHSLDIYQEHRASRIVEAALIDLNARQPSPPPDAPLALGASVEGDLYTLPGLLCELTLRELGWEVVNLGPNLPLSSMANAVRVHRPTLAWLSISHLGDPAGFPERYRPFHASADASGTAVVLGGSALGAELRSELVAASFGDRLSHLREFALRLRPAGDRRRDPRDPTERPRSNDL